MPPRTSSMGPPSFTFPKPKGTTLWMMVAMFGIWLVSALATNWGGVGTGFLEPFLGTRHAILHGQVWRLFTANFVHSWRGDDAVSHIVTSVLVLYFFGPTLESRWGWKRMLRFFVLVGVFGYACQVLVGAVLPQVDQPWFFGGLGMVDALVIAWALQADPSSRVLLFFVLPVSPWMIIVFTVGLNVLKVIAIGVHHEGLVTPFGAMLMGWMLTEKSPLRRAWLDFRLNRLKRNTDAIVRKRSAKRSGFRVIQGEGEGSDDDKRWLN